MGSEMCIRDSGGRRRETVGTGRGRGRRRVVFVVCGMEERVTDVMYSFLFLFCFDRRCR